MTQQRNAVITGTGTGFGYDTARLLSAAGYHVYGTMRDIAGRNAEPARKLSALGITPIELDVTLQHSVDRGAAKILDEAGTSMCSSITPVSPISARPKRSHPRP